MIKFGLARHLFPGNSVAIAANGFSCRETSVATPSTKTLLDPILKLLIKHKFITFRELQDSPTI